RLERLIKAINKTDHYLKILNPESNHIDSIESVSTEFIFIKADRKYFKLFFNEIRYIEGLKDYVIIHTENNKIVTAMNIKTIANQLPE
ncbi:LytTR family transcriptional regulator DNA-binding domain-containing protein, partial [Acinetobacter baumannii]